jgi:hypothetical protein
MRSSRRPSRPVVPAASLFCRCRRIHHGLAGCCPWEFVGILEEKQPTIVGDKRTLIVGRSRSCLFWMDQNGTALLLHLHSSAESKMPLPQPAGLPALFYAACDGALWLLLLLLVSTSCEYFIFYLPEQEPSYNSNNKQHHPMLNIIRTIIIIPCSEFTVTNSQSQ